MNPKSVLVIEDDESKSAQIQDVLRRVAPLVEVVEAASYQSALKKLLAHSFDLVVMDMTMPTFDIAPSETGGRVRPFAGRDVLEQLARRGIPFRAVVVTGFEILGDGDNQKTLSALDGELRAEFRENYLGSIHYNPAFKEWESRFSEIVKRELEA
jgi:CheY-like chemotaxis protein